MVTPNLMLIKPNIDNCPLRLLVFASAFQNLLNITNKAKITKRINKEAGFGDVLYISHSYIASSPTMNKTKKSIKN
jgi:hypothetical protein